MTILTTRRAVVGSVSVRVARVLKLADANGLCGDSLRGRDAAGRPAQSGVGGAAGFIDLTSDATGPMHRYLGAALRAGWSIRR